MNGFPSDFKNFSKWESINNLERQDSSASNRLNINNDSFAVKDLREKFFLNAFELYLEKTLSKNQQNASTSEKNKNKIMKETRCNTPEYLTKIQKIVSSKKNKNKLNISSKMDKFEKKMEVFKGLNSFIDIRDFLLQSNITNYPNSEELLMKLKLHYKDSLENILKNEAPFTNSEEIEKSPLIFFSPKKYQLNSETFHSNMQKIKKTIDHSKETILELQKRKLSLNSDLDNEISNNLLNSLCKEFEQDNKEIVLETFAGQKKIQDLKFHESLKKIEEQFYLKKKLLFSRQNDKNQQITSTAEKQKKNNEDEISQLDKFIKKILLKGVIDDKGDHVPDKAYLDEYKNQYNKIKKVLRKVTKNIFRKKQRFPQNQAIKSKFSSNLNFNKEKVSSSKDNINFKEKSFFLTKLHYEESPYMLAKKQNNTYFLQKNKQDVLLNGNKSLSPHNVSLKSTKINATTRVTTKESLEKSKIFKLNLPKITKNQDRQNFFDPYLMSVSSRKNSLETDKNYKQENRMIHKKFERFLKNVGKMETTHKFVSEILKEDMTEINKELKKINYEKNEFTSIRDIYKNNIHTPKNISTPRICNSIKKNSKL